MRNGSEAEGFGIAQVCMGLLCFVEWMILRLNELPVEGSLTVLLSNELLAGLSDKSNDWVVGSPIA
jgi:hypothetical protein